MFKECIGSTGNALGGTVIVRRNQVELCISFCPELYFTQRGHRGTLHPAFRVIRAQTAAREEVSSLPVAADLCAQGSLCEVQGLRRTAQSDRCVARPVFHRRCPDSERGVEPVPPLALPSHRNIP